MREPVRAAPLIVPVPVMLPTVALAVRVVTPVTDKFPVSIFCYT